MNDRPEQAELEESTRTWMLVGAILMGLFVAVFPLYRLYEPAQRTEAREDQLSFLAAQGEEIYVGECAGCHGAAGAGGIGPALGAKNFLESVDNEQLAQLIGLGVPGTQMGPYSIDNGGPMTSEEIRSLATYLRSLEEDAESNPLWQTPLAATDLTGEELFVMACSRCHGVNRMGVEDLGPDISANSLTMEESDEFLIQRIEEGRNEMPRFGRVLTAEQIDMLVTYLRGGVRPATTTTTTPPSDTTAPGDTTTTTTPTDTVDDEQLALGEDVFERTAGGEGCAACHGSDGQGTTDGPNIIGVSKSSISNATAGGVPDMDGISLSSEELDAVYLYLVTVLQAG